MMHDRGSTHGWLRVARDLLSWTTWGDRILVVALLLVGTAGVFLVPPAPRGATASVRVTGREVARLSLSEANRVTVSGPFGATEIEVRERAVRVVGAPCRGKACIRMGGASRSGQVIVCVPNEVVIEVEGADPDGFDAILR